MHSTIAVILALLLQVGVSVSSGAEAREYPGLMLTRGGVEAIRANLGTVPLFDASLQQTQALVDAEIALGIDTPVPKDFSGGYTHQRHKKNYAVAQKAGVLFQILQEEKYAIYVRDMLFQYEAMYKGLPLHPQQRSYARGKLFWQCLNESNWLVYMAQAYDTIYTWLSSQERERLENNLFRPVADFLSLENPQFFNRVHNHSTWGTAAVGMIGLVMDDDELIQRALYGVKQENVDYSVKDNDGGFIRVEDQPVGFIANLGAPFSPDGYFTEGPYYQRYAMYPFLVFSLAMHNVRPEMKILEYKDGVLLKAVDALLNLTDADGEFFPLNDAQKGMSYYSAEVVTSLNIAYHYGNQNPQLLSIAQKQGAVLLDDAGLAVAIAIRDGKAEPFAKHSVNFSDGPQGEQGGVAVLRAKDEEVSLVFKYSSHGLSHGHYDKLSFSLYEKGEEILQDYGMARFVNIQQKGGGNYLPENATWSKHTIAHNALTVNETSHFGGDYQTSSLHHPTLHFFDASQPGVQVISAREVNAYPGTQMHRTMAIIASDKFEKPYVIDLVKVTSQSRNQYDLPFHYLGQLLQVNFDYDTPSKLSPMGKDNGYQHLYLEGKGQPQTHNSQFMWMNKGKFYTLTSAVAPSDELLLARIGANDPEFNLRRDTAFILRRKKTGDTVFASVIEPHGSYDVVSELSRNSRSNVASLDVLYDDANYTAVSIADANGEASVFIVSNENAAKSAQHLLNINGTTYRWAGPYYFTAR